ncbi:unnamed protein product, partial [Timema podura]|nr:unnamed protein product [Timema podura]
MDDDRIFDDDLVYLVEVIGVIDMLPEPRRYLRDVENPVEFYSDREFLGRLRFSKDTAVNVIVLLLTGPNQNARGLLQSASCLVYSHINSNGIGMGKLVCGDLIRLSSATISMIVKVVSSELTGHLLEYVKFPTTDQE